MPPELVGRGEGMWNDLQLLNALVHRELVDDEDVDG